MQNKNPNENREINLVLIFKMFLAFTKIGAFTIGGGYAMLSLIEDEIVRNKKWLKEEEFLEGMVIAQSVPGALAVNISIVTGYRIAGVLGMIAGVLGSILPSFLIVLFLSRFIITYRDTKLFIAVFNGLKPAVVGLILISVFRIGKSVNINYTNFIVPLVIALLIKFTPISPIHLIILTIILGNLFHSTREKMKIKEMKNTENVDKRKLKESEENKE